MTSVPYQMLSEFRQKEWTISESYTRIAQLAIALMSCEYLCMGIFFVAGYYEWEKTAMIVQFLFLGVAFAVELLSYEKLGAPYKDELVRTIFALPVECLRIPKAMYMLMTLAPNYVHIISSAVAAGVSFIVWDKPPFGDAADLHDDHYRNWHDTPLIGHFVATQGIPRLLTGLVIASMLFHAILPLFWYFAPKVDQSIIVAELCDCANLQFLKKALHKREDNEFRGEVQISRLFVALAIKYPLLWLKTSFLAVMWEYMDWAMRRSMLIAVFLAWYGLLQLMPTFMRQSVTLYQDLSCRLSIETMVGAPAIFLTAMLIIGLVQQFLHLGGIWWCPETHDFSLLHGGCTKVV